MTPCCTWGRFSVTHPPLALPWGVLSPLASLCHTESDPPGRKMWWRKNRPDQKTTSCTRITCYQRSSRAEEDMKQMQPVEEGSPAPLLGLFFKTVVPMPDVSNSTQDYKIIHIVSHQTLSIHLNIKEKGVVGRQGSDVRKPWWETDTAERSSTNYFTHTCGTTGRLHVWAQKESIWNITQRKVKTKSDLFRITTKPIGKSGVFSTHFHFIQSVANICEHSWLRHVWGHKRSEAAVLLHVWEGLRRQSARPALYTVLFQLNKLKAPTILTFENRCGYICVPLDYLHFINRLWWKPETKSTVMHRNVNQVQ